MSSIWSPTVTGKKARPLLLRTEFRRFIADRVTVHETAPKCQNGGRRYSAQLLQALRLWAAF
jgi:hypothetical protein